MWAMRQCKRAADGWGFGGGGDTNARGSDASVEPGHCTGAIARVKS